jgi:hypothetical protein
LDANFSLFKIMDFEKDVFSCTPSYSHHQRTCYRDSRGGYANKDRVFAV